LRVVWHARLAGAVDGTPAVADGKVFAGSAGGELAAFDSRTGVRVWLRSGLGAISDSPAVDGDRVFAGTLTGHVLAFSIGDGEPAWDWTGPPNAAIWSSPVAYRGIVIIGVASPYGDQPLVPGRLVALDEKTGRERWSTCLMFGCAAGDGVWSTAAIDGSGRAFVGVGNPDDGLLAFDPLTGQLKWLTGQYADDGRDLDAGARPVIVTSAGREVVVEATIEGTLAALDAATGGSVWSRKLVEGSAVHGLIATPAYDGMTLYVASASPPNGVFAISAADGSVRWRHATDLPVYSAPAVSNGMLVFGTGAVFGDLGVGSLIALSTRDGSEVGKLDVHSAVRSGPALVDDVAFFGDYAGDVMAVRVSSRQ
jgi:outer membrane protein assembly factor BamB